MPLRASSLLLLVFTACVSGCAATPYLTEPGQAQQAANGLDLEGDPADAREELERLIAAHGPPKQPHAHYLELLKKELNDLGGQETVQVSQDAVLGVLHAYDVRCEVAAELHRRVARTYMSEGKWGAAEASGLRALKASGGILSTYLEAESSRRTWGLLAEILGKTGRAGSAKLAGLRVTLVEDYQASEAGRRALTLQREVSQRGTRRLADLRHFLWQADRRRRNERSWDQKIEAQQVLSQSNAERAVLQTREALGEGGLLAAQLTEPDMGVDPLAAIEAFLVAEADEAPSVVEALAGVRQALDSGEDAAPAAAQLVKALEELGGTE